MNRREFLTSAGALAAIGPTFNVARAAPIGSVTLNPPIIDKAVRPERAASMRAVLAEAKTGARPRFGMTRIDGYVFKDDLILWGRNEPGQKELVFDDLVVAIRAIRGKYGAGTPGVGLYQSPELSPALLKEMGEKDRKQYEHLVAARKKNDAKAVKMVCDSQPLFPRVIALPRDSEAARKLLDADFILKTAEAGTFKRVDPALNLYETMDQLTTRIADGVATQAEKDAIEVAKTSYGTMTFRPGRMSYVDDADVVFIDCVQVMLDAKSWRDGTTDPVEDPLFRDFAYAWTNHMDEIIPMRPDFRRMQQIFRMFALARILEKKFVFTHLSDRDVIENYLVPMNTIPDHYSRSVTVIPVTNRKKTWTYQYRHCGGVTIPYRYTVPSQDQTSEVKADVNLSARKVLESCTKETCWKVE